MAGHYLMFRCTLAYSSGSLFSLASSFAQYELSSAALPIACWSPAGGKQGRQAGHGVEIEGVPPCATCCCRRHGSSVSSHAREHHVALAQRCPAEPPVRRTSSFAAAYWRRLKASSSRSWRCLSASFASLDIGRCDLTCARSSSSPSPTAGAGGGEWSSIAGRAAWGTGQCQPADVRHAEQTAATPFMWGVGMRVVNMDAYCRRRTTPHTSGGLVVRLLPNPVPSSPLAFPSASPISGAGSLSHGGTAPDSGSAEVGLAGGASFRSTLGALLASCMEGRHVAIMAGQPRTWVPRVGPGSQHSGKQQRTVESWA